MQEVGRQQLEEILDSISDPYFEADLTGILTYVNKMFAETVQYSVEEIRGRHFRHFTDQEHIREVFEAFRRVYDTDIAEKAVLYRFRCRDGNTRIAEASISLSRDKDGRPSGFRGILRDITERLQLQEELRQAKESAEHELEIGRQIQSGFLPDSFPLVPGWEVAGRFQPAREVAGDFYDVFPLAGGKMTGLVVGDVCGKGVGAALFMALVRSLIRTYVDKNFTPRGGSRLPRDIWRALAPAEATEDYEPARSKTFVRNAVAQTVCDTSNYIANTHRQAFMFATLFFAVLDEAGGVLTYVNAGHDPPIVIGEAGVKARLAPSGPAVGLLPNLEFQVEEVFLLPGDSLLAYTDGVIDARNQEGEVFGEARLLDGLTASLPALDMVDYLFTELQDYIGRAAQFDDITLLGLRRIQPAGTIQSTTGLKVVRQEITQPATLENLPILRQFLLDACRLAELDDTLTFALKLSAEEICSNIVLHAYADLEPGPLSITFRADPRQVLLTIRDQGASFSPADVAQPDVTAEWDARPVGGLGLHFVRQLMDKVAYYSDPQRGNRWTLVKNREIVDAD